MKDIPNYEGEYAITEDGRVYSYKNNKFLKVRITTKSPYLYVDLSKDGIRKHKSIHRLVASTYIDNPNNFPEVDHIDRNIYNNHISNLRWATRNDNLLNTEMGHRRNLTPCNLYFNGKFIKWFDCVTAAAKYASEKFGASPTSITKHYKSRGCKVVKCND